MRLIALLAIASLPAFGDSGYFNDKRFAVDDGHCATGQAFTCTVQCGASSRTFPERWANAKGAEACVATSCSCQAEVAKADMSDSRLVFMIFGVQAFFAPQPKAGK